MRKRIPSILLLISPYLYVLIEVLYYKYGGYLSRGVLQNLLLIFCGFGIVVFIPNMIYAFVIASHGGNSNVLLFWNMLLLPSSMYEVSGLIQAHQERKITTATAMVNGILHFFFCADVISAIVMFCVVKQKSKGKLNELSHRF